ncbi:MAG TPA: hypothetical protein VLA51_11520 [Paracoccaceae bacterium]|nr:hypothetical protein [Paracoccaceae bacterium]
MDNKTALSIVGILAAILLADVLYFEWNLPVVLGKLLMRASDWLAFWR